ncbi:MAG: hypothetical protein PHQ75_04645, partial [Thermoguttaceae bacterium]|nr:hypothetical protein [Thermoguttaceae bacterium]
MRKTMNEITFSPKTEPENRFCSWSGRAFRPRPRRLGVWLCNSGQMILCLFISTCVYLGQTGSTAAPTAGLAAGTANVPKPSTPPALSGNQGLTSPVPQLATPGASSSVAPAPPASLSGPVTPAPAQMRMSPNAAPKSAATNPLATPGSSIKGLASPGQSSAVSGSPLAVPAAVPGRTPAGVPAAKVPGAASPNGKSAGSAPTTRQGSAPAPTTPKPKPVENPIIAAMIQKPAPGTSAIVGTPLSVNDLLRGVSNPRQRYISLSAYWTLTQKLGIYNICIQHANDVNACIQQHSPAPTGNNLILLRSAQLLAVQKVKEAELDFIQAQFRFANTITDGRLHLTESNYFAGVSSEKEKEILTKTLSIPSDPPTTMEYNTRLEEIAKTRGASGMAKTLGITIPLQYGIVKSRVEESTQAYDNLLKLFRTGNSSQELVLAALDNTTRAKTDMFDAVIEYNRMIAAYVTETVAANVRGADLMATLNQYAEEVVPVKQVRFDSTRSKGSRVPPTFAPSDASSNSQGVNPGGISPYNNASTNNASTNNASMSPPISANSAPSTRSPSSIPVAGTNNNPELPAGYGTTQAVPGALLSAGTPNHQLSGPVANPASPSYTPNAGTGSPTLPQNNIGTGSPIYGVDSIINNANSNDRSNMPAGQSGTPSGSSWPVLSPPASPQAPAPTTPERNENGPMPFSTKNFHSESPLVYSEIIIRGQAPLTRPGTPGVPPTGTVPNPGKTAAPSSTAPSSTTQDPLTTQPVFPPEKQQIINELVRALFPVKAEESGAGDSPIIEIPLTIRKAIERSQGNSAARLGIVESYWKLRSKISELEVEKSILQSCQLVYSSFEKGGASSAHNTNPELTALIGSFKAAISAANARIYQARINIRYSQIDLMQKMGQTTDTGWPVPSSYPYCGPSYRLEIDKARRNNFSLATESVLIPEKLKTIQMIGMALGPVSELFRPNISSLQTPNDGYLYLKTLENNRDSAILFIRLV